ncbi:Cupredoxin [Truncatella angustata]|uniref:laccase n=1 Tax=Truncatella angustata TaxID=152316 RepID=A0A9P8UBV4_9PEZI|nr:Cupredoxin [Truncatella angustata]KAH6644992.1 Cupredoxin [Truncatella angustata]
MQSLLSFKVTDLESRASTCNSATNRACWQNGFSVTTDYETSTPSGTTRSYSWEVTEIANYVGPDGVKKAYVQLINGQYPGPTLFADWGDTISVTIKNSLPHNGTSFHWHGIRQFKTNIHDGVNGVTECPIPPGHSKTYTFKAQQYGTSWYHSHTSAQYGDGIWGTVQIAGPASNNYDIDLGVFPVADYYYNTAEQITLLTQSAGPPPSDNVMINGTNINPLNPSQGKYAVTTLTPGKRHLLRVINPSVENNYQISLVGHKFTVIGTDFVPVSTATTDNIFLAVGQRYDILIDADQKVDNYWFNVTMFSTSLCGTSVNPHPASIFRYAGASNALPTNVGTVPPNANCQDNTQYGPVVSRIADQKTLITDANDPAHELDIALNFTFPVTWYINGSAINVNWDRPVLDYVLEGNTSYPRSENLIFVDKKDTWTYWVVQNKSPIPHPMHLHGHDFLVLGHAAGTTFTSSLSPTLNFQNPTRRDVTMLPGSGYLVIAFRSDNPGNWLFHCHIAWHVSGGLSSDFMERRDEQKALISAGDLKAYQDNCAAWKTFSKTAPPKIDSGLRL